jgi:hypothetical protein
LLAQKRAGEGVASYVFWGLDTFLIQPQKCVFLPKKIRISTNHLTGTIGADANMDFEIRQNPFWILRYFENRMSEVRW